MALGLLVLFGGILGGYAQENGAPELDEAYITEDGAFQFSYPSNWTVDERPDGAVELTGPEGILTIYPPNYLAVTNLFAPDMRTPATLMDSWIEASEAAGSAAFELPTKVMLAPEQTAVRADFVFSRADATGPGQFMLAAPASESLALLLVLERETPAMEEIAYALAVSMVVLDDTVPEAAAPGSLSEAVGLPTAWQDNVAVLEEVGLIEGEGELVWSSDYLTTVVGGPFVVPEDTLSEYPNIAGGVFVSFRPDTDERVCGLMSRFIDDGDTRQLLFVGLNAEYGLLVIDLAPETADEPAINQIDNELSFFNPQQLMYVLRDNRVTLLINGEIVAEDLPVSLPEPDSNGVVSPGLAGAVLEMSCVMTDAWAYGFEDE